MREWHRTVILIALIVVAVLFLVTTQNSYETNFEQTF